MPAPAEQSDGTPVWIDLASSNVEASIEFYTGLFGWTYERAGAEFNNYVNFSLDGTLVAGLVANNGGDAWNVYLKTSDAEGTAASVVASGGQVFFQHHIADLGEMIGFADSNGATTGAWQP
ncbi:MAG: glyoxalase, partial [Microbacteriaceae bacterium]|nr:glyoxalase [Microbacteriaceae bacterium]